MPEHEYPYDHSECCDDQLNLRSDDELVIIFFNKLHSFLCVFNPIGLGMLGGTFAALITLLIAGVLS